MYTVKHSKFIMFSCWVCGKFLLVIDIVCVVISAFFTHLRVAVVSTVPQHDVDSRAVRRKNFLIIARHGKILTSVVKKLVIEY